MTEVIGLFFLLSSLSVTSWFNKINDLLIVSIMWPVLIVYILVLSLRFKINLIKCFANIPRKQSVYLILLVFGVYSLAGTIYSIDPVATVKRSLGYIFSAYFFLLFLPGLFRKTNDLNIERLIWYLNLSFLLPVVAGLVLLYAMPWEVTYMQGPFQRFTGIYGTQRIGLPGNPNAVGYASFFLASISIIGYTINKVNYLKLFYLGAITLSIISILASGSRTALFALVIVLIILFFTLRMRRAVTYVVFGVVLLIFCQFFGIIDTLGNKVANLVITQRIEQKELGGRVEIWEKGIASLNGLQFFTGYGLGSITKIKDGTGFTRMMNQYVEIFVESGLIGIILFVTFLCSGFIIILKRWRSSRLPGKKFWGGILAFYCGLLVYCFSESLLMPINPAFHLLLLCISLSFRLPLSQQAYGFVPESVRPTALPPQN